MKQTSTAWNNTTMTAETSLYVPLVIYWSWLCSLSQVKMLMKLVIPQQCSVQLLRLTLMMMVACLIYRRGTSFKNEISGISIFKSTLTRRNARRLMSVDLASVTVLANTTEVVDLIDDNHHLPRLSWHAAAKSSVRVKESCRTCEEYMRLPPSECTNTSEN